MRAIEAITTPGETTAVKGGTKLDQVAEEN